MKYKEYKDKVYGVQYIFILDVVDYDKAVNKFKKENKKLYKVFGEKLSTYDRDFSGVTFINGSNILIMVKENKDKAFKIATIGHELLHASLFAFEGKGVEVDLSKNNEHLTYYFDHLLYEVLK
jgi:hypothetical protein